jgi:LysR family carnitine catabolism transcriptional activator
MAINVTVRQLEILVTVARTLSFSKAAKAIHLSQPALSSAVRKLEAAIGARIFDRDTRNVSLTPAGAELLAVAEDLLQHLESGLAGVRDYLGGTRGRLSVAASPSIAAGFLPDVVASFQRTHPGIALQLHDTLSDVAIDMLRSGKADLALAPEKRDDPALAHRTLFHDELVLLCRTDHPLTRLRGVTWRQIIPFAHIAFRRTSSVRHLVEAAYARENAVLRPAFEVEYPHTMVGLVANGLGVGVLPYSLMRQVKLGPVVHRRITAPEIRRDICLVARAGESPSPASEAFIQTCIRHAQKYLTASVG